MGYDLALVGTALMRAGDPTATRERDARSGPRRRAVGLNPNA